MSTVLEQGVVVANWTIVLVRGQVYNRDLDFFADGNPDPMLNVTIVITPNEASPLSWTLGAEITNTAPGEYFISVTGAQTTSYLWSSGSYRVQVVNLSGVTNPCIIEGLIFVRDC